MIIRDFICTYYRLTIYTYHHLLPHFQVSRGVLKRECPGDPHWRVLRRESSDEANGASWGSRYPGGCSEGVSRGIIRGESLTKERGVSLERFPGGSSEGIFFEKDSQHFFQKNASFFSKSYRWAWTSHLCARWAWVSLDELGWATSELDEL